VRLNPDVPSELERIINRALEKDRELRYQHASEMRSELQRLTKAGYRYRTSHSWGFGDCGGGTGKWLRSHATCGCPSAFVSIWLLACACSILVI
ncbi:MAG: hypothetical protein ABSF15_26040, partial [Candidatus Sulfotelmatobacter sp.]